MSTERADRAPHSADDSASALQSMAERGVLDSRAVRAVLVAAGHGEPHVSSRKRAKHPGGLSKREVDVLELAAKGFTTKEIADRLNISSKTADHHIQHIYTKIGVSTRAAAALWAMQSGVVG
jgi:DNA-binding NarL/FixJ family response regulator